MIAQSAAHPPKCTNKTYFNVSHCGCCQALHSRAPLTWENAHVILCQHICRSAEYECGVYAGFLTRY